MGNAQKKTKEMQPWDRRPWPPEGDKDVSIVYYGVGLVLSQWERYEAALSCLFSAFVSFREYAPARRAFSAVRTFEGRWTMLQAASMAYFDAKPDAELQSDLKKVISSSHEYSARRNDVAHGVADYYSKQENFGSEIREKTFALYPSQASFKERTLKSIPSYCLTSAELIYFYERIFELQKPAMDLCIALVRREITRDMTASLRKLYEPAPQSTTLMADLIGRTESPAQPESSRR